MKALSEALKKIWLMTDGLPASSLTKNQQQALDLFGRETSAVDYLVRGRGGIYKIARRELVEEQLKVLTPSFFASVDIQSPKRTQNIAATRNSKTTAHGMEYEYLLLRGIDPTAIWYDDNGTSLDVFGLTQQAGVAAMRIQPMDSWYSPAPLWLVENQTLFDRIDWLPTDTCGTLCYYAGNLTRRFLEWLAYRERTNRIIFFPDYDGVGLQNFVRLLRATNHKCEFWLMPRWEELLQAYGSNQVFLDNLNAFNAATPILQKDNHLVPLINSMQKLGLALEQEVVWLSHKPNE